MTAQTDPYVRVYYRVADDERFARIYPNDAALATWLRLLILADGLWPSSAPIPRWCRKQPLALLAEVGLVELVSPHRYRIHGMQAERERRAAAGRNGADARWQRNAVALQTQSEGNADRMHSAPLRSEPLRASPRRKGGSKDPTPLAELMPDIAARFRKPEPAA